MPPAAAAEHAAGSRRAAWALLAVVAVLVAIVVAGGRGPELTVAKAALLGAVEGVTEFLPVSSTGHLLVVERLLGLPQGVAADTYAVAIQLGAIAAVVLIFWSRIRQLAAGLVGRDPAGRRLLVRLVVAFVPAALVGAVLEKPIKDLLFRPWPIVVAWIAGGLFLVVWRQRHGGVSLDQLTVRGAALIGLAKCSRSGRAPAGASSPSPPRWPWGAASPRRSSSRSCSGWRRSAPQPSSTSLATVAIWSPSTASSDRRWEGSSPC